MFLTLEFFISLFLAFIFEVVFVHAESHTIKFDNQCGFGTPVLIQGAKTLSSDTYTVNGPFSSGIAYLQTGKCLFNGEGCSLVEMTLGNPTTPGSGSSVDISLIPPHAFSEPVAFSFFNGCDGQGASCASAHCDTAFFVPDDNQVQVACQANDVNLLITFCGNDTNASSAPGVSHASQSTSISRHITISTPSSQAATTLGAALVDPSPTSVVAGASPAGAVALPPTTDSTRKACRRRSHRLNEDVHGLFARRSKDFQVHARHSRRSGAHH